MLFFFIYLQHERGLRMLGWDDAVKIMGEKKNVISFVYVSTCLWYVRSVF